MEFKKNQLLQAMLVAALATGLAACGSDGDDGAQGAQGEQGQAGNDGSDGQDLTAKDTTTATYGTELTFVGVPAPQTDADKRAIFASNATINGETFGGSFNLLARSGTDYNGVTFGQLVDENGTVLQEEDGSIRVTDSNEHTSLLPVGDKLFSVSQMESRPGAMFLMELNQNETNGELTVKNMSQIDQSSVNGGWVHCAASVTPWTTHLASEEYEPDARELVTATDAAADSYSAGMLDYYTVENQWNPYYYGWNIEIEVNEDSSTELTKHYAMARLAFELSYVMPDSKTVYMTDDGTNVGLYMFVADEAGDLSAGTTYVAKFDQQSAEGLGEFNLSWISLGHATNDDVKTYVDNGTTFADIFDAVEPVEGVCADGYTSISANGVGQECLAVKEGMEVAASRLETRRYAAMLGGTTELRKEEGITFDETRGKLYLAISEVARGMEDFAKNGSASNSYDLGGNNDIRLASHNSCGGVYQLDVAANADMGSDYVASNMSGLIAGRPVSADDPQVDGFEVSVNACHIDGIASPDNVTYMSGYDYLIVGEDTGSGHQNDVIWAYDFDSAELTRIQTTPYGSETTSPYWYPNINGWSYMMSVVQHPYGESDTDKDTGAGEARAYTGYIGPFPGIAAE